MQRKQIMSINSFDNYPMSWKPDLSRASGPKYLALVSLMEDDIKNGTLKAGTKLPPQRELADYLNVNLSTISRAFKLCSQKGLLSASHCFLCPGTGHLPVKPVQNHCRGSQDRLCPCAGPVSPRPGHYPLFHEYFHLPAACSRIRRTDYRWNCR